MPLPPAKYLIGVLTCHGTDSLDKPCLDTSRLANIIGRLSWPSVNSRIFGIYCGLRLLSHWNHVHHTYVSWTDTVSSPAWYSWLTETNSPSRKISCDVWLSRLQYIEFNHATVLFICPTPSNSTISIFPTARASNGFTILGSNVWPRWPTQPACYLPV